ncbi:hypothetical protein H310_11688 [Aphanomyces invadans]|uniref:Anoctamin transmembrane domain-containing protein n=1 Tax=Aphanomyces invadans TaxID=157072 RepID=A0A024TKN8_9STRA|nr:hypothetical protein H310_11688 [Aphanomyces invadans]ETV94715.1 hypothetical protein H310_11688 [Aphanomyces invadans]|eukprot:XP_008876660.1 hypothetical protein H310_11688 [Aphanomyces invadans]
MMHSAASKRGSSLMDKDGGDKWMYALIFPNNDKASVQYIVRKLEEAALQVKLFYSTSQTDGTPTLIICKIRANLKALRAEAARINLPMLMDPQKLEAVAKRGLPEHDLAPFEIGDSKTLQGDVFHPYENIHMKYDLADDVQDLYQRTPLGGQFSSTQRMMLIDSIIVNVAHVNVDKLKAEGVVLDCFPLHEEDELVELKLRWVAWNYPPWRQPITHIKNYFGSKVAMYFAYLGYYTTWLFGAGLVGLVVFLAELLFQKNLIADIPVNQLQLNATTVAKVGQVVQVYTIPAFGTFMVVWATLFLEGWKRKSARLALEWGTANVVEEEQPRPQFHGEIAKSPITSSQIKFFDPMERLKRRVVSWLVLAGLLGVVIFLTALIFMLRYYVVSKNPTLMVVAIHGREYPYGSYVAAVVNLAQIFIMYKIYDGISLKMNDYENHSTESAYEANYILKAIIFHFVNSYAALIYVASLKNPIEGHCLNGDCFSELRWALIIIYGSQIVIGNIKEVLIPRFFALLARRQHKAASKDELGSVELQFFKSHYGWKGTFDDFLEMVLQFGYSSFFVVSFPLTPLLSFLNNMLEIRIDGYRLTEDCRRPRPHHAANIGLWSTVLEQFVTIAIITNAYVIFYTRNYAADVIEYLNWTEVNHDYVDLALFVAFVTVVLLFRGILSLSIPDVPEDVAKQLARQAFLASKILDHKKDDDDEALKVANAKDAATLKILDADDDEQRVEIVL